MISENDLSRAEWEVLSAFRAHKSTVSIAGADAEIRGDFLRGLFLGEYGEKADYRGTFIENAIISDVLDMEFCETKFPVRFLNCRFEKAIQFQQLTCPELNFAGCTLKNGINALYAIVAGGVFMRPDRLDGEDIKEFHAEGGVCLACADIGGQLVCIGKVFKNGEETAFTAQGAKVANDIALCGEFNGEVCLTGAEIGGQLICAGGSFQNEGSEALVAQSIRVASGVFLIAHAHHETKVVENFSASGRVLFDNATIGGDLKLESCEITHLSLSGASVLGEFWDDASIYKDREDKDIDLNIDGFRYQRLGGVKERAEDRLDWVGSMSEGDDFYPQPYEQLMKVYCEMGHMNLARKVGFELEKKRHKQLRLNRDHKRFVVLGWAWWFWYWVLRGTIGYGYKPFRAVTRWFTPLIVAGFLLFNGTLSCSDPCRAESDACHCMAPSDAGVLLSDDWKVHGKLPKDYPDFDPVFYAVETTLPVLPLGQTENWHPKTPWIRRVRGAITFIGALVLTILASYGVGVLGPRWKNE